MWEQGCHLSTFCSGRIIAVLFHPTTHDTLIVETDVGWMLSWEYLVFFVLKSDKAYVEMHVGFCEYEPLQNLLQASEMCHNLLLFKVAIDNVLCCNLSLSFWSKNHSEVKKIFSSKRMTPSLSSSLWILLSLCYLVCHQTGFFWRSNQTAQRKKLVLLQNRNRKFVFPGCYSQVTVEQLD